MYTITCTSELTGNRIAQKYGTAAFHGLECQDNFLVVVLMYATDLKLIVRDQVTLSPSLVIHQQSIGAAHHTEGWRIPADGVLGVGPVALTLGTLTPDTSSLVPTVTNNLFMQHTIPVESVAFYFEPTNNIFSRNGEMMFGGTDSTRYTEPIQYVGYTNMDDPENKEWTIDASIRYGDQVILAAITALVDTGYTRVSIATGKLALYAVRMNY